MCIERLIFSNDLSPSLLLFDSLNLKPRILDIENVLAIWIFRSSYIQKVGARQRYKNIYQFFFDFTKIVADKSIAPVSWLPRKISIRSVLVGDSQRRRRRTRTLRICVYVDAIMNHMYMQYPVVSKIYLRVYYWKVFRLYLYSAAVVRA